MLISSFLEDMQKSKLECQYLGFSYLSALDLLIGQE